MADIVSKEKRSEMMSGIRGKNTKPELLIRKGLHAKGFRYKLHVKDLAGQPDIVLPKYKAVIFIHGCFWHKHSSYLFKMPSTRVDFWEKKLNRNVEKDKESLDKLKANGWRILIIWECAVKGRTKKPIDEIMDSIISWLKSDNKYFAIRGKENGSC